jgi:hypothetical protein
LKIIMQHVIPVQHKLFCLNYCFLNFNKIIIIILLKTY